MIRKRYDGEETTVSAYDKMLNDTARSIYRLIFATAIRLNISPTKLAKTFKGKQVDNFAEDFVKAVDKEKEKEAKKAQKVVDNLE